MRWPTAIGGPDTAAEHETGARKDANEVLLKDGKEALRRYIQTAEPYPIRGLFRWGLILPAKGGRQPASCPLVPLHYNDKAVEIALVELLQPVWQILQLPGRDLEHV